MHLLLTRSKKPATGTWSASNPGARHICHHPKVLRSPKTYRAFQAPRGFRRDEKREKKKSETSFARIFPGIKRPVWRSAERVKENAVENCYHRLSAPKEISLAFQRPLCTSPKKREGEPPAEERRGAEQRQPRPTTPAQRNEPESGSTTPNEFSIAFSASSAADATDKLPVGETEARPPPKNKPF